MKTDDGSPGLSSTELTEIDFLKMRLEGANLACEMLREENARLAQALEEARKDAERMERALERLMACAGDINACTADDLCLAANDGAADSTTRKQAAAFLEARAALAARVSE